MCGQMRILSSHFQLRAIVSVWSAVLDNQLMVLSSLKAVLQDSCTFDLQVELPQIL